MLNVLIVVVFGGLGSLVRYGLQLAYNPAKAGGGWPWGTLAANVVGCVAMGIALALFKGPWSDRPMLQLAIVVGVLGGLTTFSSFAGQAVDMLLAGDVGSALLYIGVSNVACLGLCYGGYRVGLAAL